MICATLALPCAAQVTPAAAYTPPDDTPSITRRRHHLRRLHRHPEAEGHGRRRQRVHAQLLQRRPSVHQRHRQHLAHHRVPGYTRHHPRDRHRQLAQRQLHLPTEVRLRAVQPGRLDDARLLGRGSACSRHPGSTSRRASTDIDSRARCSPSARASCRRPTSARRSTTTCRQLRRDPCRLLQRRELQPLRGQRSEGVHDSRHGPAAPDAFVFRGACGSRASTTHDAYVKNADRDAASWP